MSDTTPPHAFRTIAEIETANRAAGQHWFDRDAVSVFEGFVPEHQPVIAGRFFISSERGARERRHTIRYVSDDARIRAVGRERDYESFDDATAALMAAAAQGPAYRQVGIVATPDPTERHWVVDLGELALAEDPRPLADAQRWCSDLRALLARAT